MCVRTTFKVEGIETKWRCHPRDGFLVTRAEYVIALHFQALQDERAHLQRGLYGNPLVQLHKTYNYRIMTLRLVCKRWFVLFSQLYTLQQEKAMKGAELYISLHPERF